MSVILWYILSLSVCLEDVPKLLCIVPIHNYLVELLIFGIEDVECLEKVFILIEAFQGVGIITPNILLNKILLLILLPAFLSATNFVHPGTIIFLFYIHLRPRLLHIVHILHFISWLLRLLLIIALLFPVFLRQRPTFIEWLLFNTIIVHENNSIPQQTLNQRPSDQIIQYLNLKYEVQESAYTKNASPSLSVTVDQG